MSSVQQDVAALRNSCIRICQILVSEEDADLRAAYTQLFDRLFVQVSDLESDARHWFWGVVKPGMRKKYQGQFEKMQQLWQSYLLDSENRRRLERHYNEHAHTPITRHIKRLPQLEREMDEFSGYCDALPQQIFESDAIRHIRASLESLDTLGSARSAGTGRSSQSRGTFGQKKCQGGS